MITNRLREKIIKLTSILKDYGSLAIALSGGVDSVFLLTFAEKVLKKNNLLALTGRSVIHFDQDLRDAVCLTDKLGIKHVLFDSKEMYLDKFLSNGEGRCYFCKKNMFDLIKVLASDNGFRTIAHGANADDINDYRPGFRAAYEANIMAPLVESNFSKEDVRYMLRIYGVEIWDKPAMACVATRFPYGTKIDSKVIKRIKNAEVALLNAGFNSCRVRHYGDLAKIEIDLSCIDSFPLSYVREKILKILKSFGYIYVSLDLEGYKQGNMNSSILSS